jgi:hypothetical protein
MASEFKSSWEGWGSTWSASSCSDREPDDNDDPGIDYANVPADIAAEEFGAMLVDLKLQNVLSARQCCVLAFWASRAGAKGVAAQLCMRPDQQSGAYSRHFDGVVGCSPHNKDYYFVNVGRRLRHESIRRFDAIAVLPPHEILAQDVAGSPDAFDALTRARRDGVLPRVYDLHPWVQEAPVGEPVLPICVYLDGVSYSRTDTVLGVFVYFMLSGCRHLIATIRKSEYCSCGCKGWCSIRPLLAMVAWSLSTMRTGRYPTVRHDGTDFGDGDEARKALAGTPLGFKAVCLFVKGDWMEYIQTLGLPSWATLNSPCPLCVTDNEHLFTLCGFSALSMPSPKKSLGHFLAGCTACERVVLVSSIPLQRRITAALEYDKRDKGNKGRALVSPIPELSLEIGDRLEPGPLLDDVAAFERGTPPFSVCFWRCSEETVAKHRNPLFALETGVSLESLGIDWLHSLSLGSFQHYLAYLVWALLLADPWNLRGPMASKAELGIVALRSELWSWYSSESSVGRNWTRIQGITVGMLGTHDDPHLKLHGSETNGFLMFARELLRKHGYKLGLTLPAHTKALDSLVSIYEAIKRHPANNFSPPEVQHFCDDVCQHFQSIRLLQIPFKPKHHMLMEQAARFSAAVSATYVSLCIH